MSWLKDRIRELTVTKHLRLGPNASIVLNSGTASESVLSLAEQAALDGVTAGTATASKAVVLGAFKEIATITSATITTLTTTTVNAAGAVRSSSATAGVGYATGAGGTETQANNKSTGVSMNKVTGIITMHNQTLNADVTVSFTLTNTAIAATDAVIVLHESAGTLGAYSFASTAAAGSADISVHNNTPGNLGEAIVLRFVVIKSVNA